MKNKKILIIIAAAVTGMIINMYLGGLLSQLYSNYDAWIHNTDFQTDTKKTERRSTGMPQARFNRKRRLLHAAYCCSGGRHLYIFQSI